MTKTLEFFKASTLDFIQEKRLWIGPFLILSVLGLISLKIESYSAQFDRVGLIMQLLSIVVYFIMIANFMMTLVDEKKTSMGREKMSMEERVYGSLIFIVYSVGQIFFIALGLVLFILPGAIAFVTLILAPFLSIHDRSKNPYKHSFQIATSRWKIALFIAMILFLNEALSFLLDKNFSNLFTFIMMAVFSIVDSFLSLLCSKWLVELYYSTSQNQIASNNGHFENPIN